ncbi:MAG: right-handed parallel beta-helix repeat-containing protein [Peptococcaceae bacterium]|nr:right-handed parallel beta-helix repeat-containing protein [Peptococcaceae bacterium]
MKKFATMAICFVLIACMVAGGSLAYLTDRDSEANVFTVGDVRIDLDEKFPNGKLIPGEKLQKEATIKNIGNNDAFVWMTIAVPAALDTVDNASANVIHWNVPGAFWEGYHDKQQYIDSAIKNGYLPENSTGVEVEKTWNVDDKVAVVKDVDHEGTKYNVYTLLYNSALKPGETTNIGLSEVYMDPHIDIDTENNWYHVEKGEVKNLNWNHDEDKNGYPVIYVSAYAIQNEGFEAVKDNAGNITKTAVEVAYAAYAAQWTTDAGVNNGLEWAATPTIVEVATAAELQNALDNAEDGDVILLTGDITGDVTATQKADVKVTINGDGHKFAGVITVDGKSATYTTAGLTIQNVNFEADSISADACINLGEENNNNTRYTCNVTVKDCTFDVPGAVGVKSYTGGDKNLTISGCTATDKAHSLVQAKGIDGVLVEDCTVNSKNGLNFNNSDNVTVDGCNVNVKGYAVRFGESSGGVGAAETYLIKNCTLKSANDDGDAVIILRGTADNSTLTIENTTITGTPDITNTATGATVVK